MDVGPWVREKLECLRKYLHAYTTILRKQRFQGYFYVDAFAGPGSLKIRKAQTADHGQRLLFEVSEHALDDAGNSEYISGSPQVALDLENPFTDYVFIELDNQQFQHLQALKRQVAARKDLRIHLKQQDCNSYILSLLERMRGKWSKWRGIVFLDPFGMQVPWSTLVKLAETEAIEVLINFPVGMAIQRLLKRSGDFSAREREKLNEYFGTDEWFRLLYKKRADLFGNNLIKIRYSGDLLVKWYSRRLKKLFGYVSGAREVQSSRGHPLYYLIFAGPNETGYKIASDILKQGARRIR